MAGKQGNISRMAMKAMGLFGGVQVAGILCSIIRTKLVALWIGPVGIDLFGLFNNALEMISTGTNLGIRSSSVRAISQAMDRSDKSLVARMVTVVRKWSMWLGLAGALLTLVLAPLLSQVTFGDSLHIWGFVALSVAVLLQALTNGEYAVLQGTARLKRLASVTLWGTLVGLAVSIPLFYLLRERSILPSILAYAMALAAFAWIFRNRDYAPTAVSRRETFDMGKGFVRLGIYMTLGNFATILASYLCLQCLAQRECRHRAGGLLPSRIHPYQQIHRPDTYRTGHGILSPPGQGGREPHEVARLCVTGD